MKEAKKKLTKVKYSLRIIQCLHKNFFKKNTRSSYEELEREIRNVIELLYDLLSILHSIRFKKGK
jgi:hypothetical protein